MIGKIRIFLALGLVVVGSLILVPLQILSMKTGWWPETFILKIWHRLIIRALGMRIHVKGTLSSQRPLLVASNHISWTDIMVLGSMVDVKFIARADMEGWPLIGMLSKLQRTVFIERERKRSSGDQASEIASRMAKGDAMVLFAEGSTGDGNIDPAVQEHAVRRRLDGDFGRGGGNRSSSSRWRSSIRACMACRSAAGTGRLPPGSAMRT